MSTCVLPPVIYYVCNKKCGEIRMTADAVNFQLICEFCTAVFKELHDFINHIKLQKCEHIKVSKQIAKSSQQQRVPANHNTMPQLLTECVGMPTEAHTQHPTTAEDPLATTLVQIKEEPLESTVEYADEQTINESTTTTDINNAVRKEEPLESTVEYADEQNINESTTTTDINNSEYLNRPMETVQWSDERVFYFIEKVRKEPYIWDYNIPAYKNRPKKQQFWQAAVEELNETFKPSTPFVYGDVVKKWNNLKSYLTVENHRIQKATLNGASLEEIMQNNWKFKASLDFLDKLSETPTDNLNKRLIEPMLNTKEKLLTFINAISKAPLLWNHSHMDYSNAKLKCQAQDNIAYIMNKEFHTKLCGENIDKQIKSLHDYWIKIKRGECKKTWFSSHLEFFNIYKASSSNDQLVYLIQLFRKFDMLWNREHPQYLNAFEENAAYTKMARLMSERFGNYTKVAVMNSLQTLQTNYFNFMEGKITAFCYYDQMKFLDKFIGQKQLAAQAKTQNNTTINPTKAATVTKATKSLAAATKEVKLIEKTEKVTFIAKIKDIDCDDTSSSSGFKGFPENASDMAVNNEVIEKVNNATSCNNAVLYDDEIADDKKKSAIKKRKHKLFISHKVTLALIELYRAKSALWDREDENFYKAQVRSKELAELVSALNSRYNLEVSDIDVRKRITSLRVAYKRFNTTNKYFKQLAFLPRMRDKHRCQYCNQQFMRRQELYAHEYKHTLKKQLPCDQCDKRFTGPAQLRLHQLRHLDKEKYKFLCHECGEHFSQLFQLKHHTYKMHNVPWPQVCNVCQRGFRTRSRLLAHQVQHSAKTTFLCAECGKSFKSIGYLKNHMQSHLKLKNHSKDYVCVICNKRCGTCKNLLVHKQTHASEPKFNCRLCKKRFRQYSSYYYHMQHQHRGKSRF